MCIHPRFPILRLLAALVCAVVLVVLLASQPAAPAHSAAPSPQVDSPGSDFYGINFIQPRQPWLTIGYNSGARVVRWQFNWRDIEPDPGNFVWAATENQIAQWTSAGLQIHAILHNPPDFALETPGRLVPNNPGGDWNSGDSTFGRYCYRFAEHFRGKIASYEIWNEPDLDQFWGGSSEQYYQLMKACYRGIRAADPVTPVAMAGMAYTENKQFFDDLIRIAADDPDGPPNHNFFDVMAIHMYSDPELIYKNTQRVKEIMDAHGMGGKPVWITETNVPLWGENGSPSQPVPLFASQEEASWYVLQAASNAIAAGAGKLMFFRLADDDMHGEAWGLVANSGTPRPAYRALQVASSILRDITQATREVRDGDVVITDMKRKDGAHIVAIYTKSGLPATMTVPAQTPAGILVTPAGDRAPIEADSSGNYTITVPGAPRRDFTRPYLYTVGGPVIILVESDRDPPTATVETFAIPDDKLHIKVRWRGNDGKYGTGVALYDVQVSDNGTDWQPFQTGTTATEGTFDISKGGAFAFRVRATDRVGNVGEYSAPVVATLKLAGVLSGQILDLRGQGVPSARVTLSDGSLHDADATGLVHMELPLGVAQVTHIDGGLQGEAGAQPAEPIVLAEETTAAWVVAPRNLIANGDFSDSLIDWEISSPDDAARVVSSEAMAQSVLRLSGQRRPWGLPAASITAKLPPDYTSAIFSFTFRMLGRGQTLRLRAISGEEQTTLWYTQTLMNQRIRVWTDVGRYAGREVTFRFELWGPKGSNPTSAEIDDVFLGNVPILPPPQTPPQ